MKKWIALLCLICLLPGCAGKTPQRELTCQEIIDAYEAAGYTVTHKDSSGISTYDCYICVAVGDYGDYDEYIYFHRFASPSEAESYADTRQFNVLLWLFSAIYGDTRWMHTTYYGPYEIEYVGSGIYEPFAQLIG